MRFLHEKTSNKPIESIKTPAAMEVSVVSDGNTTSDQTPAIKRKSDDQP